MRAATAFVDGEGRGLGLWGVIGSVSPSAVLEIGVLLILESGRFAHVVWGADQYCERLLFSFGFRGFGVSLEIISFVLEHKKAVSIRYST